MKPVLLSVGWMLVLLALFSIPSEELPQMDFRWADKIAHAVSFFVLGLLWMRSLSGSWRRRALITLAIGVLYGIGTEFYQGVMPLGRRFDPLDAVADAAGALLAVGASFPWFRKKAHAESNRERFTVS